MTTAAELARRTVKDLRSLASRHRIPGRARMKKAELVAALAAVVSAQPRPSLPSAGAAPAGSSPTTPAPAAPSESGAQEPDPGLPIPTSYGRDRLVLMAQDPHHVFAYWELAGPALERARAEAGPDASPVLVVHSPHGSEQRLVDLAGGNYYLAVAPDGEYSAELALRAADGRLIRLVCSNPVRTPAATPSQRVDEDWLAIDESFEELLIQAGLPGGIGSSASLVEQQRLRARLWSELSGAAPMGSSGLPSSPRSGGFGR